MAAPKRRRRAAVVLAVVGAAFVVAVAAMLWALTRDGELFPGVERCTVTAAGGATFGLTPEQAANAATIAAVGMRRGLGTRAATIAVATAMQESKLRNLAHGDRDSLGLFQQRPSQGWGTEAQVRDPVYASEKFFAALVRVPGWEELPLTEAAQKVQRSAFPDAYADHEDEAAALAAALTGRRQQALTCRVRLDDVGREQLTGSGLTPRAVAVRTEVERAFGRQSLGGFAPGGVSTGHVEGSAHYDGRAVDILYRPADAAHKVRGWATAQFLVAHASRLQIATVIYDDRIWTARRSGQGWRSYVPSSGDRDNATNRHLDHVHVDVERGG